jgi:hypothetical protein
MNPKIAGRLSTEAANFYRHAGRLAESQVNSIDFALLHALHEFMPDDAVTAVFEPGGDSLPLIVGARTDRLYAFDVPEPPAENQPVADVRWRSFRLAADSCSVEAKVSFNRPSMAFGHEVNRRTHWKFRVDDLEFDLHTSVAAEAESLEPREELAQHLARCLGVLPESAAAGRLQAAA